MLMLYTQLMLERGILASHAFYSMYAHTDAHVSRLEAAANESFAMIAEALEHGGVEARLKGPVAHAGFKRLT